MIPEPIVVCDLFVYYWEAKHLCLMTDMHLSQWMLSHKMALWLGWENHSFFGNLQKIKRGGDRNS